MNGFVFSHIMAEDRRSCCATGVRAEVARQYEVSL